MANQYNSKGGTYGNRNYCYNLRLFLLMPEAKGRLFPSFLQEFCKFARYTSQDDFAALATTEHC